MILECPLLRVRSQVRSLRRLLLLVLCHHRALRSGNWVVNGQLNVRRVVDVYILSTVDVDGAAGRSGTHHEIF